MNRVIDMLKTFPESGHPMDALASVVAAMGMFYFGDHIDDAGFSRTSSVPM